ncbi:hypothetical protein [Vallitalea guaymasensis]|uniref:hypothetical protein n=1 Tax=Vallitalea guaymasensis TaxID=1185412 RepID=UPI0023564A0A|nr:hypothetical protein [Vallitalea guaymasensis]
MDTFKIQTDGLKSKTYSISYVCSKIQDIKDDFMNITSNIDYDVKCRQAINGMINTCLKQLNDIIYNMDSYIKLMNDSADSYNNIENELLSLACQLEDEHHIPMIEPQSLTDERNLRTSQMCDNSGGYSSKAFKYEDEDIIALKKGMQDIFKDNDYVNDINFENIFGEIDSDIDYDFEENVEYFLRNCEAYLYSNRINLETTYKSLPDEYKLMVLMHWVELMKDDTHIDVSNVLPDEYFENVPSLPFTDRKLGNITSENKYESEDAYNYFKKYYYPIQALYQFQKGDFEQLKRTAFMEWARLAYGSSKKEQGQEFRAGLFFGGVTSPIKGIYDTIEGIYSVFTHPEQLGFFITFVVSLPFSSKNRELMKLMIKQTYDEWKAEYDNADAGDKGFMIGQLIGEAITFAVEAGGFVKGIKGLTQFVKNGGFRKAVKQVVKMGSSVKKLLKMKPAEFIKSVKKIFKRKDHYEVLLNNDELVKVPYDDLTVMQKSKFDGFVDSHMQNDVVPDRVYGEDGIGIVSGEGTGKYTGIGKTGKGIPQEKVSPEVLKQIEPDSNAAYGYSPKKGTPYEKYDFTDIEKANENRLIREDYLKQSKVIQNEIEEMTKAGASKQEIADKVVTMRNTDKVKARAKMPPEDLVPIEQRNLKIYGNKIGPDAEWLFKKNKLKFPNKTDIEIWDYIIESSMKKDKVINTLLGIEH